MYQKKTWKKTETAVDEYGNFVAGTKKEEIMDHPEEAQHQGE
jgi:hypothetical protein